MACKAVIGEFGRPGCVYFWETGERFPVRQMSVIVELRVAASEFELGRILGPADSLGIELETVVPLHPQPVPSVIVRGDGRETVENRIARHPSVEAIDEVERHDGEVIYRLDWDASRDGLVESLSEVGAQLLSGRSDRSTWAFEARFPSHDSLPRFRECCEDAGVGIAVDRIRPPWRANGGPWPGLTEAQRKTLVRAVEGGYYTIPRQMSTMDLAEEFGVSDQAVSERLRRAVAALTRSTLIVEEP